ncbi:MAG: alpha-mannosidase [Anaerolineae bacterium]
MKKRLYMIGNAHIDPVWLWPWQEGFHEVKASFRSALDRMTEFPDFVFVASSAAFYEWVEKSDPQMFTEIQARVEEGRWGLVGGWWVEPDCNVPSGESFVRHSLYGQGYFQEKFGQIAKTGFNIDSFGHSNTLPQILAKSGIENTCFLRPMPHEKALPARLFWWESDDGSRVLAFRIPFEYLSWGKDIEHHIRRCAGEMKAPIDAFMCFYGVGNHGGGPTIENIEAIHRLDADPEFPLTLQCATPDTFFRLVRERDWPLPVVRDELQNHASGSYAAHSGIKRWNRMAENHLLAAEAWSALADRINGQPYPQDFAHAWKQVLFNQFHDILAGTSLPEAYEDARNAYGEALAIADRNLNYAVQSFAWDIAIKPEKGMAPIVVFNPLSWPVRQVIEIESSAWSESAVLLDDAGATVPHQQVPSTTVTRRRRLSFSAELPALGYATYRFFPEGLHSASGGDHPTVEASDTVLENAHVRLEIDAETGCIGSLFDKHREVEVFRGAAARPEVLEDVSDTWGHNTFRWDKVIGTFEPIAVSLVEHGPVRSTIRVTSRYRDSSLIQDFRLYPDGDQIDVRVTVDWREQLKMLKLRFPVNVKFMKVTRESAYGHIELAADGDESPMQRWVDLSGISRDKEMAYGLSLLNDGKYSVDVNVSDIGLTVLRSPAYAHHIPSELEPGRLHHYMDQGIQHFNYSLLPHAGSWENAGTVRRAAELNRQPSALFATYHPEGRLPQRDTFVAVEPDNVMVTVLKQAEEGDALILRAVETTRSASRATIRLPNWSDPKEKLPSGGRVIEADFTPCEIKTFRIPHDPTEPITEVDLLERAI